MDYSTEVNIALFFLAAVMAVLGWFARQLWSAVQELKKDLTDLKVQLATNYVPKSDFVDGLREVKDMLGKIFDKLDNKVDK